MKKSSWILLTGGGIASLLFIGGISLYFFRYIALDRRYTQEGKAYMAQKNYPKAIEAYTRLAKIHPQSCEANAGIGRAYYAMGRYDDAITYFGRAIPLARLEKSKAYCYTWRGACYSAGKVWDAAIDDYATAIARDPQHWNAYRLRGKAYSETKRFALALRDLNEAIRIKPDAVECYETRAILYAEAGQRAQAILDCRKELEMAPRSYFVWHNAGWAYYLVGEMPDAIRCDRRALELNEKNAITRFNLGLCFAVQNNTGEAKKEYALALADSKASQRDSALIELKKAQAEHPNTPAIEDSLLLFAAAKSNAPRKKPL